MKREIKFRGYDKNKNKLIFGPTDSNPQPSWVLICCGCNDLPLMQYTGLKDKNGVEIYDGDIIENHQADINVVHWYGNGWCYQNYHANSLPLDDLWNPYDDASNEEGERFTGHEIVGNIHQNPELLIDAL